MRQNIRARSEKLWNRLAKVYNKIIAKDKKAYMEVISSIRPLLSKDMHVLEIGTGTGVIALAVADSCRQITATDFSEKMIAEANKNPKPENLSFSLEDAMDLSFPEASFDAAIISNTLHILPEPELVLKNIAKVLKKMAC